MMLGKSTERNYRIVLLGEETPNQRKKLLLQDLQSTRALLKLLAKCAKTFSNDDWSETITLARGLFKREYDKLLELERWRKREGIGEDEQYRLFKEKTQRT